MQTSKEIQSAIQAETSARTNAHDELVRHFRGEAVAGIHDARYEQTVQPGITNAWSPSLGVSKDLWRLSGGNS